MAFARDFYGFFISEGPLTLRYARLDGSSLTPEDETIIRKHGVAFGHYRKRYFETSAEAELASQKGANYAPIRHDLRELACI